MCRSAWIIATLVLIYQPASASQMLLHACPDSPNCVSSLSTDKAHYIEPFSYTDTPQQAWQRLQAAVLAEKRVTPVKSTEEYLHVEVRSLIFRFTDDVEFLHLPNDKLIHIRSASRIGYSDFGVNRRRLERIRTLFNQE
jgi:uncharacterized protein (DUF1499 family)